MKEVFEYTPTDINRLIRDDLVKRGKLNIYDQFTISSSFNIVYGKLTNVLVKIQPVEVGINAGYESL